MGWAQWYELRVVGSAGTRAGTESGIKEGIALAENGRLCPVPSGQAKRFTSEKEAMDFLAQTTIPGIYRFEAVLCKYSPPQGLRR
ncbi:MAG TPA: hypothetical protein VFG44_07995 [Burkholderiales bacterium]|jgi:hypothetical protein|nr:hypothetical protein [Burkholderiales bacterium]